jgi:hypothetical protein
MANDYPSPCDKCEKAARCDKWCLDWEIRYRYRQNQINAYAKRAMVKALPVQDDTKFRYEHPDDNRRYLRTSPCEGCIVAEYCDTPCPVYLKWWDERMAWFRRKLC